MTTSDTALPRGSAMALRAGLQMTPFCRKLGLTAPVVQAPVGSATTPELAAAVSHAGGLGMLALTWTAPGSVRERIRATRALTDRPFGVNLVLEWDQHERVRACVNESVAAVSTFWGDPRPYVEAIHAGGALHLYSVGSAEEARRAVDAGVDVIVAQGWEAGGRVRGEVAALPLVPAVVDAVRPVPVIAAGGVADGRGLAAVLVLGADAAWVGTRFLLTQEANVHHEWRRRLQAARETSTLYSTIFDRGWSDAPHRTLRNSTVEAWQRAGRPAAPGRPGEGDLVAHAPDGSRLYRYDAGPPVGGTTGDVEALALYAGQSAGIVNDVLPAAAIVEELISGAAQALTGSGLRRSTARRARASGARPHSEPSHRPRHAPAKPVRRSRTSASPWARASRLRPGDAPSGR
jgi:nitronate monooxygenase